MILLLLVGVAFAGDPPAPAEAEAPAEEHIDTIHDQLDYGMGQVAAVKKGNNALKCFLLDKKAVGKGDPDVPKDWVQPSFPEYEAEGAPCSFIPGREEARLEAERIAKVRQAQQQVQEPVQAVDTGE